MQLWFSLGAQGAMPAGRRRAWVALPKALPHGPQPSGVAAPPGTYRWGLLLRPASNLHLPALSSRTSQPSARLNLFKKHLQTIPPHWDEEWEQWVQHLPSSGRTEAPLPGSQVKTGREGIPAGNKPSQPGTQTCEINGLSFQQRQRCSCTALGKGH